MAKSRITSYLRCSAHAYIGTAHPRGVMVYIVGLSITVRVRVRVRVRARDRKWIFFIPFFVLQVTC